MADVGDWSAATLATPDDVRDRFAAVDSLIKQTDELSTYITRAKDHIGRLLDVQLIHHRERISVADLADLKDLIANPEVMKEAAVAFVLMRISEANIIQEDDIHAFRMSEFSDEFNLEYDRALSLLQYDEDRSEAIDQDESAGGVAAYRFSRV